MPIVNLQKQQARVGRIRIGQQQPTSNGKTRPAKLEQFRLTAPSQGLIQAAAARYGGDVERWEPPGRPAEWQVVTPAASLEILVPPHPVQQWMELWSGAGCLRRCDGVTETLSGEACMCPLDVGARADEAAKGRACKIMTRLKVMLPELPGVGVWELVSHGYFAGIELPQTAEFLGAVTEANGYIRATLELEKRQVRRPGVGVREFMVPALHVYETPDALMAGAGRIAVTGGNRPAIGSGPAAIESAPSEGAREQAQALAERVKVATDREALAAIWKEAAEAQLTGREEVADDDGVLVPLLDFIQRRGQAFTQPAAPPVEDDVDALWGRIVTTAPADWTTNDLEAEFQRITTVDTGSAEAEHMRAFLDHLASVTA